MTFLELTQETLRRVGEDPATPAYYTAAEAGRAVNAGYRMFALATLSIEASGTVPLVASQAFAGVLSNLTRFLTPLRVTNAAGLKLLPANLAKLTASSGRWQSNPGAPGEYAMAGAALMVITPQPTAAHNLTVLYAASPAALAVDGDTPVIPDEDHEALVDYAAHDLLSIKEGASRAKDAASHWEAFLGAAQRRAALVRARAHAEGYDAMPMEIRRKQNGR